MAPGATLSFALSLLLLAHPVLTLPSTKDFMNNWCGEKDCYALLGVSKNATTDGIAKAYKKLAFQYHPDKNPGRSKEVGEIFQHITHAYGVVGNAEVRQRYDEVARIKARLSVPKENPLFVATLLLLLASVLLHRHERYRFNAKKRSLLANEAVRRRIKGKLMKSGKKLRIKNNSINEDVPDEMLFHTVKELNVRIPGGLQQPRGYFETLKAMPQILARLGRSAFLNARHFVLYVGLKRAPTAWDKEYITAWALGLSEEDWASLARAEREKYLSMELWREMFLFADVNKLKRR